MCFNMIIFKAYIFFSLPSQEEEKNSTAKWEITYSVNLSQVSFEIKSMQLNFFLLLDLVRKRGLLPYVL